MVKRHYFDFYEGVHKDLSDKHDWFVRRKSEYTREYIPPYYYDGSLDEVIKDAIEERDSVIVEIANCEWIRNTTVDIPCQYNVMVVDGIVLVTEAYMDERLVDYGFKRDDNWAFRHYWNHKTQNYVHWELPSPLTKEDTIIMRQKSSRKLLYNGDEFKIHFGSSLTSNGTTVVLGKKLPYDEKQNIAIPMINEMRSKMWNGVHEDIVQYLMKISGVKETEVKDK